MSQVVETPIDSDTGLESVEKRLNKEIVLTDKSISALKEELRRLERLKDCADKSISALKGERRRLENLRDCTDKSIGALKEELRSLETLRVALIAMKRGVNMDAVLRHIEGKGLFVADVMRILIKCSNEH